MWPFLFQDGDKNQIELVYKSSLAFEAIFRTGALDDEAHHKVTNPCVGQNQRKNMYRALLLTLTLLSG